MTDASWKRTVRRPEDGDELRWSGTTANTSCPSADAISGHSDCHAAGRQLVSCLTVRTQLDSLAGQPIRSRLSAKAPLRFGTVEVRHYPIVLSDNPSTTAGPPIGIGWRHDPEETFKSDIASYEALVPGARKSVQIPPHIREGMLLEAGYSRNEIRATVQRGRQDKKRRNSSSRQQKFEPILAGVETVRGGLRRLVKMDSLKALRARG